MAGQAHELDELFGRGYRYALALCHDPDRASDLLQDACVSCIRAQAPWQIHYLFAAIRSRFIDQNRRQMRVVIEPLGGEEELSRLGVLSDPERDKTFEVDKEVLRWALGELRPEEREVLFLGAVEGYSAREIGELVGRPRGTILSMAHRARQRMRELLRVSAVGNSS